MGVSKYLIILIAVLLMFSVANAEVHSKKYVDKHKLPAPHISIKGISTMATVSMDNYEPDNEYYLATKVSVGSTSDHTFISGVDREDWIKFTCNKSDKIKISTSDWTALYAYDSNLNLIGTNIYSMWDSTEKEYVGYLKDKYVIIYCPGDKYTVYVDVSNISSSDYQYSINVSNITGGDDDNVLDNATSINVNSSKNGTFSFFSNDEDYYKFNATAGKVYLIETTNRTPYTDTVLGLYNPSGSLIGYDDDSNANLTSLIMWKCPSDGTYFVSVLQNTIGNGTNYTLSISELNLSSVQDITLNQNITSDFSEGVIRLFKINLTKSDTYVINATALQNGLDSYINLYDSEFDIVTTGDDHFVGLQRDVNPIITTYLNAGVYYIAVNIWDGNGSFNASATNLPSNATGKYDSHEPDNNVTNASIMTVGDTQNHTFYYYGESDFVNVTLNAGVTYVIYTKNLTNHVVDTMLVVYDSSGNVVAFNDDVGDGCNETNVNEGKFSDCLSKVVFTPSTGGVFTIESNDISAAGNEYSLTVDKVGNISLSILGLNSTNNITKDGEFEFTTKVSCIGGYCGNVSLSIDPQKDVEKLLESAKTIPSKYDFSKSSSGRYIILLKENPNENQNGNLSVSSIHQDVKSAFITSVPGIKVLHKYTMVNMIAAELTPNQLSSLKSNPFVLDVVPDRKLSLFLNESVPQIGGDKAHSLNLTKYNLTNGLLGSGQTACVIDTGINWSHPALKHACIVNTTDNTTCVGYNAVNGSNNVTDTFGHGTHVAGIIISNDSVYTGVAPNASLIMVKVRDNSGNIYPSYVISGIDWCLAHKDDYNISVISMSLGTNNAWWSNEVSCAADNKEWLDAVKEAIKDNVSIVAASGNEYNKTAISAPACLPGVISVGAVNKDDEIWENSSNNQGTNIAPILDLLAPGKDITSTSYTGGFIGMTGTSMAAPHVAGAILLINQLADKEGLNLSVDDILSVLKLGGKYVYNETTVFPRINIPTTLSLLGTSDHQLPVNQGYPFYITSHDNYPALLTSFVTPKNVSCLSNMENGDNCFVTWIIKVNTTGTGSTWQFFVDAISEYHLSTQSNILDVNITNISIAPSLKINSPLNDTNVGRNFTVNVSSFCNSSIVNYVQYRLSNGSWSYSSNLTRESFGIWIANVSTLNMSSGDYNLTISSYNYFGDKNESTITIHLDSTPPSINITSTYPQNNLTPNLSYDVLDDVAIDSVWYNTSNGEFAITKGIHTTNYTNLTKLHLEYPGWNYFTIYANDTANNTVKLYKEYYEIADSNLTKWALSNSVKLIPNGTITNNNLFNVTITANNSTIELTNVNGTAVWWNHTLNIVENNSNITELFLDNGLTTIYSIYLDKDFVKDKICNKTYQNGILSSEGCSTIQGNYSTIITTNFTFDSKIEVFNCGRGISSTFSECYKLPECNATVVDNCYFNKSGGISAKIDNFSTIVIVNDTTPPNVKINSPIDKIYSDGNQIYNLSLNVTSSSDTINCNYSMDGGDYNSMTFDGNNYLTTIGPIKNGNHNVTVRCEDGSDNIGNASVSFFINDDIYPTINVTSQSSSKSSITISWNTNEPTNGTLKLFESSDCIGLLNSKEDSQFSLTHSLTITDLASSTTYYYTISSSDYQGNTRDRGCNGITTQQGTTNVTNEPGEAGSGGGNTTNQTLAPSEVFFWTNAEGEIDADVQSPAIAVDFIKVFLKGVVPTAKLTVKSYDTTPPTGVESAPGIIYQYFDISTNFPSNMSYAILRISLPVSWFERNNYNASNVTLYHYDYSANTWNKETLIPKGKSGDYYIYESTVNRFSPFAVSTSKSTEQGEFCGNGICNQTAGESCSNCEKDCGKCLVELLNNNETNMTNSTATGTNSISVPSWVYIVIVTASAAFAFLLWRELRR